MPSRYLLNKIKNGYKNNNFSEMFLSIYISMTGKKWVEIHPEHLRIILLAIFNFKNEGIIKDLLLEILEESQII